MADVLVTGYGDAASTMRDFERLVEGVESFEFMHRGETANLNRDEALDRFKTLIDIVSEHPIYSGDWLRMSRKKHQFIGVVASYGADEMHEHNSDMSEIALDVDDAIDDMMDQHVSCSYIVLSGKDTNTGDYFSCGYILNACDDMHDPRVGTAFTSGFRNAFTVLRDKVIACGEDQDFDFSIPTEIGKTQRDLTKVYRDKMKLALQKAKKDKAIRNDIDLIAALFEAGVPSVINGKDLLCSALDDNNEYQVMNSRKIHSTYTLNSMRKAYGV